MTDTPNDNTRRDRRKRYFVDPEVQSALIRQLTLSWVAVFGFIASLLLAMESIRGGFALSLSECLSAMWTHNAPVFVAMCILAPMMIFDVLRVSHRFVGPMVSFRRSLQRLGEGETIDPIRFRRNDFWRDLETNLNLVIQRIEQLESKQREESPEAVTVDD